MTKSQQLVMQMSNEIDQVLSDTGNIARVASGVYRFGKYVEFNMTYPIINLKQVLAELLILTVITNKIL